MAEQLKQVVAHLLPHQCYDEYFLKHNYLDADCFKITLSKLLGIAIIAGSVLVKVPQIVKLLGAKSGEGLNLGSVVLELLAITSNVAYSLASGFPFSAWGEGLFLLLQTITIAVLVLHYESNDARVVGFVAIYSGLLYWLTSGMAPTIVLSALQASTMPIVVISKTLQAIENYKNGSTGQLSAVTVFLLFGGSLARIFTSIQETGDQLVIITYVSSSLANSVLLAQIVYYWNSQARTTLKQD